MRLSRHADTNPKALKGSKSPIYMRAPPTLSARFWKYELRSEASGPAFPCLGMLRPSSPSCWQRHRLHPDYYSTTLCSARRMRNHQGCWSCPSLRAPPLIIGGQLLGASIGQRSLGVAKRSARGGTRQPKPIACTGWIGVHGTMHWNIHRSSKLSVLTFPNDRRLKQKRELTCAYYSTCRWVMRTRVDRLYRLHQC